MVCPVLVLVATALSNAVLLQGVAGAHTGLVWALQAHVIDLGFEVLLGFAGEIPCA